MASSCDSSSHHQVMGHTLPTFAHLNLVEVVLVAGVQEVMVVGPQTEAEVAFLQGNSQEEEGHVGVHHRLEPQAGD